MGPCGARVRRDKLRPGEDREYRRLRPAAASAGTAVAARRTAAGVAARAARAPARRTRPAADAAADGGRRRRDGVPLRRPRRRHDDLRDRRHLRRLHARHGRRHDEPGRRRQQGRDRRRAPRLHALPRPGPQAGPAGRRPAAGRTVLAVPAARRAVVGGRVPADVGAADNRRRLRPGPGRDRPAEAGGQPDHPGDQAAGRPGADERHRATPVRPRPLHRAEPADRGVAARLRPAGAARRPGHRHRADPLAALPAGHLPGPRGPADRRGCRARTAGRVGLGEVAAARPPPAPDRRGRPDPAGHQHPERAGGAARRGADQPAPAPAGGEAAHHRPARPGGARRRRGRPHQPTARPRTARHHRARPVRGGSPGRRTVAAAPGCRARLGAGAPGHPDHAAGRAGHPEPRAGRRTGPPARPVPAVPPGQRRGAAGPYPRPARPARASATRRTSTPGSPGGPGRYASSCASRSAPARTAA